MTTWVSSCPKALGTAQFYAPQVPGSEKTVALTFDDGPGPSTAAILAILEAYGVRATFFNVGKQEVAWPAEVRAEAEDGFLIGDHTWNHLDLAKLPPASQASELDKVVAEQESLTHTAPCVMRPPDGDYDKTTLSIASTRHMSVWMWSVDTEDWEAEGSSSPYWVNRIVSLAESEGGVLDNPVVLMHNQEIPMPATVAALPEIIEYFKSHGYTFVDLLGDTGPPASCSPTQAVAQAAAATIPAGTRLRPGETVTSPGGQYRLTMGHGGDLVLSAVDGTTVWSSRTTSPGAFAVLASDGDFAIYSAHHRVLWSTGSKGDRPARLALAADGVLSVLAGSTPIWTSGLAHSQLLPGERLEPGWYLQSPAGRCRLVMQSNGDLVFYSGGGEVLWSTQTAGSPGASARMGSDGDLDVVSAAGKVLWSSGGGRPGGRLEVGREASISIALGSGTTTWAPS